MTWEAFIRKDSSSQPHLHAYAGQVHPAGFDHGQHVPPISFQKHRFKAASPRLCLTLASRSSAGDCKCARVR